MGTDFDVTGDHIAEGLAELGIAAGATLLVHSSLKSFGRVEGGAETVIRSLLQTVGPAGNVVMPTLTFKGVDESAPFFSVRGTPSETGLVTETFRRMPNARRSRHPLSSAAAIGRDADTIAGGRHTTPCGSDSPYRYVYDVGGYALFLGAGFRSNTLFHVAEELAEPPYMRYKKLSGVRIERSDGEVETDTFYRYDCYQSGIVRRYERLEDVYSELGMIRETTVGGCRMMLISARDNVDAACDVLKRRIGLIWEGAGDMI